MTARYTAAFLPTIEDMPIGSTGWTVPWAMVVYENRDCYLRGEYGIEREPGGTVDMHVTRTADGYAVDLSRSRHRFTPGHYEAGLIPIIAVQA